MTGVQVEAEVLEALEFEPRCEVRDKGKQCPAHASWLLICTCPRTTFYCSFDRDLALECQADGVRFYCRACNQTKTPEQFIPIGTP